MRLSKDTVAALALPPGRADQIEWDDELPGFGVRLRGGSKRWVIQYRVGQQQRRESLGDVRKVRLDDARKIARQQFAKVELGIDPAAERAHARAQAAADRLTLKTVTERYLDVKEGILRPNTYRAAVRYLTAHWGPLSDRPIDSIARADVAARLQELVKLYGRTSAARARTTLSALFSWGVREALCASNPVVGTNDPAEGIQPRERVLTDQEIATIWNACQEDDFGSIVRLLTLTGCRREEIGGLRWDEVNLDTGSLLIPGTRTKNRRALELTLPTVALDILRTVPRRDGREYVFGSRGGAFSAWSYSTLALNARIVATHGKPLTPWRLHDLRRTMRTGLGRLGVPPHIAELVINHAKGGVEAIYDRYRYSAEKTNALARWADHVLAAVEGREARVVPLVRA